VFRMYPNRKRKGLITRTFGCRLFVWNRMLTEKRVYYLLTRDTLKNVIFIFFFYFKC
jgi:hypothetical protein